MYKFLFHLIFGIFVLNNLSCSDSNDNNTPLSQDSCSLLNLGSTVVKIINGASCTNLNLSPVVRLKMFNQKGNFLGLCTGTIVNNNTVLTAGHCLNFNPYRVQIITGEATSPIITRASSYKVHPDFKITSSAFFNDVAVVKTHLTLKNPSLPILLTEDVSKGDILSIFGYGISSPSSSFGDDLKSGEVQISDINQNHITSVYNGNGSNTCLGDSGGPLIKIAKTQGPTIAGIVSTGTKTDCQRGDRTLYTNLQNSSILDFLNGNYSAFGQILRQ